MTTYTAVPDSDIDANSPVTATLMTLLRDNPIAITEKAAGAPVLADGYIVEAMYAAGSVDQTAIKTATSAQSVSGSSGNISLALTGGTYSMVTARSTNNIGNTGHNRTNLAAGREGVYTGSGYSTTFYIDSRYFQASPPYGTTDGIIPLFIDVEIEKGTGKVLSVSVAPDPIWAYHGPTDIRGKLSIPDTIDKNGNLVRKGKMVKRVRQIVAEAGNERAVRSQLKAALIARRTKQAEQIIDRLNTDEMVEIEITLDYKNSDMNVFPHPWIDNNLRVNAPERTGPKGGIIPATRKSEFILLDPQNTEALAILHHEGENVLKMIEDGVIKIDNTPLNRIVPKGMRAYGFKF